MSFLFCLQQLSGGQLKISVFPLTYRLLTSDIDTEEPREREHDTINSSKHISQKYYLQERVENTDLQTIDL